MSSLKRTLGVLAPALLLMTGSLLAQGAPDAKQIYDRDCRKCHGVRGTPPQAMKRIMPTMPTFDAALLAKISDDSIVAVLKHGKGENMKPFTTLTAEEMKSLARYIRELGSKPAPGGK